MKLTIHNLELAEPAALATVIERVRLESKDTEAVLHVSARGKQGWLEYGLILTYLVDPTARVTGSLSHGRPIYIGCIEREPGAQMEFHS